MNKIKIHLAIAIIGICAGAGLEIILSKFNNPNGRLIFLSVGQGDSILFQSDNYNILIDAGPHYQSEKKSTSTIIQTLRKYGVKEVDLFIITHPDMDHIGGMEPIHSRYPIKKIALNPCFKSSKKLTQIFNNMHYSQKNIFWIKDEGIVQTPSFQIKLLNPCKQFFNKRNSKNDSSLYTHISNGNSSATLTGDASSISELFNITKIKDWKSDILKAGHHGSRYSTCNRFLRRIQPAYIVFSCGRNNPYNHPHPNIIQKSKKHKILSYRTDFQGDIVFLSTPTGFRYHP